MFLYVECNYISLILHLKFIAINLKLVVSIVKYLKHIQLNDSRIVKLLYLPIARVTNTSFKVLILFLQVRILKLVVAGDTM